MQSISRCRVTQLAQWHIAMVGGRVGGTSAATSPSYFHSCKIPFQHFPFPKIISLSSGQSNHAARCCKECKETFTQKVDGMISLSRQINFSCPSHCSPPPFKKHSGRWNNHAGNTEQNLCKSATPDLDEGREPGRNTGQQSQSRERWQEVLF